MLQFNTILSPCTQHFLHQKLLDISKWQFQSEAANQPQEQVKTNLGHKYLGEEPEGDIHSVVLHLHVLPVGGDVEQVGHEGDLGDGGPQSPGQEVIDGATITLHTGKHYPGEADAPASLVTNEVCLKHYCLNCLLKYVTIHTLYPF